jgi:hypothetical protein
MPVLGRERNGSFGVTNGDKQTFVHRIANGSRRPDLVVPERKI